MSLTTPTALLYAHVPYYAYCITECACPYYAYCVAVCVCPLLRLLHHRVRRAPHPMLLCSAMHSLSFKARVSKASVHRVMPMHCAALVWAVIHLLSDGLVQLGAALKSCMWFCRGGC